MERLLKKAKHSAAPKPAPSFATHEGASDAVAVPITPPPKPVPAPTTGRPVVTYELRALLTEVELYDAYRLRYEVYRRLGYLQSCNKSEAEMDIYDLSSVPFGAFDAATGELVGTLRLIKPEPQLEYDHLIAHVLAECFDTELTRQALEPRPRSLPSIVSDEIERQIEAFNTPRFAVYEFSRFIIHPDHRFSNVSRGLGILGMAHAMRSGPAVFIAGCLPEHNRLYASYGFVKLPYSGLDHFDTVNRLANTLICRSDALPRPMRARIDELVGSMASGAVEHAHELSRDSRAIFRFAAPRRARRDMMEW